MVLALVITAVYSFTVTMNIALWLKAIENGRKIEDGQRGNTCILLIRPDIRNEENVKECIDANSNSRKFDFDPPSHKFRFNIQPFPKPDITVPSLRPTEPSIVTLDKPVKIIQKEELMAEKKKEYREVDGVKEFRYDGDTFWQKAE